MLLETSTDLSSKLPAGIVPEWIELVPAGPEVIGQDGRRWLNDQPDKVVASLQARNRPIVVDWEHSTERRAPKGEPAPAAGWLLEFKNRAGAIFGRVNWTPRATEQLGRAEYKFLSPVIVYERDSGRIVGLSSAALTNTPNLNLQALNSHRRLAPVSAQSLTQTELTVCNAMGISPEAFRTTKTAQALNRQRNPGSVLLTATERQVCAALGISEAEFYGEKMAGSV